MKRVKYLICAIAKGRDRSENSRQASGMDKKPPMYHLWMNESVRKRMESRGVEVRLEGGDVWRYVRLESEEESVCMNE